MYFIDKLYICYINNDLFISEIDVDNSEITYYKTKFCGFVNIYECCYNTNNNIYIFTGSTLYNFDILTKNFKCDKYCDVSQFNIHNNYYKISNSCLIIGNKFHNLKTNEKYLINGSLDKYECHESNNIKDNIYFNNYGQILIKIKANIHKFNNYSNFISLTNGVEITKIPKDILIKRSKIFENMFTDCNNNDNNISLNFKFYDYLEIYLKYIQTGQITEHDKLFELFLFLEDIDIENLSNYIINLILNKKDSNYEHWLQNFNRTGMKKQYYQLLNYN